jgi:hypothetical protein
MIGPADEFFVHQITAPLEKVASDNPHWQDRFYFNFIDPDKRLSGILAMGFFPNMKIFQGILNAAVDDKLICKNYFRPIGNDRLNVHAGSLEIAVKEPLKSWTMKLDEPDLDFTLDLTFTGRTDPHEFERITFERDGESVWDQCHYTQCGKFSGTLKAGGLDLTNLVGVRDRSWGIRNMAKIDFWIWISANFDDCWLTAWLGQTAQGEIINADGALVSDDGSKDEIKSIDYEIEFMPGMRTPASSSYSIGTESGRKLSLTARRLHTLYVTILNGALDLSDEKVLEEKDRTTQIFDQTQVFDLDGSPGVGMAEFFTMGGCHQYPEVWKSMR